MKKIYIIILLALSLFSLVSCQDFLEGGVYNEGMSIYITDKTGRDLLDDTNPNCIAGKISVTRKGESFEHMHPTDLGREMKVVHVHYDYRPDCNNYIYIKYAQFYTDDFYDPEVPDTETYETEYLYKNQIPWEKGEQISITMPDGTKHTISYVGKDKDPLHRTLWLFDGAEEFYREYTIVYDPE